MPDLGRVSQIDSSKFDAGSAYVAVKKPLLDDFAPYIFRTHDFGQTWTQTVTGIASNDYVHAVREDPARKGLLYAATQHGVYISYDDGDHWQSMRLNLPDTPVTDLWVEANDLAITIHGRGFYILDNVQPLRQYAANVTSTDMYLFKPGDATRDGGNATISYMLKSQPQKLAVEIVDSKGQVVRTINGAPPPAEGRGGRGRGEAPPEEEEFGRGRPPTAGMTARGAAIASHGHTSGASRSSRSREWCSGARRRTARWSSPVRIRSG